MKSSLEPFLSTLSRVNSDHHKAEVFRQLSRDSYSDKQLVQILEATKDINSDHHQAETLIAFAPAVANASEDVKDAYFDASENINSDSHVGRVLRAIR